jgi:hypothetical protein
VRRAVAALLVLPAAALVAATSAPTSAATSAAATPTPSPTSAPSGPVFAADFEDGTPQGFVGDPPSVSVATVQAAGSMRLSVGGLTGYAQGARATLPAGLPAGYYGATAAVRLPSGEAQDLRLVLPDSPAVSGVATGIVRARSTATAQAVTYFRVTTAGGPVSLRVEPVAHCSDAPATPLPFLVDDVRVTFYGTIPPPLPLLPTPSCPLSPGTTTTSPPPAGACQVSWTTFPWNGGYQASVTVTNRSPAPVTGWRVTWTFRGGESLLSLWTGGYRQDGARVTVTSPAWNPDLASGGTLQLGLVASNPSPAPLPPTDVALNGVACTQPAG